MTKTNEIFEACLANVDHQIKAEVRAKAEALYPINEDDPQIIRNIREYEQQAYIRGCEDTLAENDFSHIDIESRAYTKGYEDASKIACDVYADLLSAQGYNPIDVNKEIARMKKAIEEGGEK